MNLELLVARLLESENTENNNLIDILGNIKPSISKRSSLTAIIRGLFTKNKKLLSLLNNITIELAKTQGNSIQLFKNFVNDFIIWLDNDGLLLFEKYLAQISDQENASLVASSHIFCFGTPILNCANYVEFIDGSIPVLRNPFIVEKLTILKTKLAGLINNYNNFLEVKYMNNISFNDVRLFGEVAKSSNSAHRAYASNASRSFTKVSSFFKTDQIVERTRNDEFFIVNGEDNLTPIELVLLNLSGTSYNSLALLTLPRNHDLPRSLMYPPFRVNELSIVYIKSENKVLLKSIDFSSKNNTNMVTITSSNSNSLYNWYKKLESIFPLEESDSPVSQYFLINSGNESQEANMSGLGINVLSDKQHKQHNTDEPLDSTKPDKQLYPIAQSNTPSLIFTIQNSFPEPPHIRSSRQNSSSANTSTSDLPQPITPPFAVNRRKLSNSSNCSSINSFDSSEALRSQYDRSLNLINETLSNSSSKLYGKDGELIVGESGNQFIKSIKRNIINPNENAFTFDSQNRPISSQAEIDFVQSTPDPILIPNEPIDNTSPCLPESYHYQSKPKFSSVPDLSKNEPKNKLYHLSSGSAVDISNFGKKHNPSFNVVHGLSSMPNLGNYENESSEDRLKQKRKSIFNIFKKPSKVESISLDGSEKLDGKIEEQLENVQPKETEFSTSSNHKGLSLDTSGPVVSDALLSGASDKSFTQNRSSILPSPFALPSSTSMYFFKPYKNGSSSTINGQAQDQPAQANEETDEAISIPQNLKDIINGDSTIDFYISPCSPKSMKISKWKQKYGKWEMFTLNENLFLKLVINYDLNKSWLIIFKEEYDQEYDEIIDKPILLLDINSKLTSIRQSSALDIQVNATNAIDSEKLLIMIRCNNGNLSNAINSNLSNILGVLNLNGKHNNGTMPKSKFTTSSASISSSIMDSKDKPSTSSTLTSLNSSLNNGPKKEASHAQLPTFQLSNSLKSAEITIANVLNNPENSRLILLNQMTVRVQRQLESYAKIHNPSSWKILSMYSLNIFMISDNFTNKNYYSLELICNDEGSDNYHWLICEDDKFNRIERIGKAGLLIRASEDDIFMIECKGRKEFKVLFEVF